MSKLNVLDIIVNHLKTLNNFRTKKTSKSDIFTFIIGPSIFGILMVMLDVSLENVIGDLLKAIAIFSAFLFNMLAIVNTALSKESINESALKVMYAKEIHSNLSFEILIGIVIVCLLLIQSVFNPAEGYEFVIYLHKILEGINFSLIAIFFLTLIMCLNRVYVLLRN